MAGVCYPVTHGSWLPLAYKDTNVSNGWYWDVVNRWGRYCGRSTREALIFPLGFRMELGIIEEVGKTWNLSHMKSSRKQFKADQSIRGP